MSSNHDAGRSGLTGSIRAMFQSVGKLDAVVSTARQAKFASLDELTDADYQFSFSIN